MAEFSLCKMQLYSISPVVLLPRLVWCLEGRLRTAGLHSHGCSLILLLSNIQTMQQHPQDRSPPWDWLQARPNSAGRICSKRALWAGSSSHRDGSQPPLSKVWVYKFQLSLGHWNTTGESKYEIHSSISVLSHQSSDGSKRLLFHLLGKYRWGSKAIQPCSSAGREMVTLQSAQVPHSSVLLGEDPDPSLWALLCSVMGWPHAGRRKFYPPLP